MSKKLEATDLPKDLHEAAAVIEAQNAVIAEQADIIEKGAKAAPSKLPTVSHEGKKYGFTVPQFYLPVDGKPHVFYKSVDAAKDPKLVAELIEMGAGVIDEI